MTQEAISTALAHLTANAVENEITSKTLAQLQDR